MIITASELHGIMTASDAIRCDAMLGVRRLASAKDSGVSFQ
jgi:hypothetical protein